MRYPFEPLERKLVDPTVDHNDGPAAALCELLGIAKSSLHKYRLNGLPSYLADEVAVRAGFHPFSMWEDWGAGADEEQAKWEALIIARDKRDDARRVARWWKRLERYSQTVDPEGVAA